MDFRKDINGLRAIAVLAVVLYHFKVSGFNGGFVGVDVFFVISGYLMTAIISKKIEGQGFSFLQFYLDRCWRILPALLFLCITLAIFGWHFLPPTDYRTLAKHLFSTITFLSNIIFWREDGYFDETSTEKWLLHTWSLSVEWQFYLIYPIILTLAYKFTPRKHISRFIGVFLIASLLLSALLSPKEPTASFYLLPTRAWEMLLGAQVFFLRSINWSRTKRSSIAIIGLASIFASILYFDATTSWPSWRALLPSMGTALIIASHQQDSLWASNALSQLLGKISYSVYLWHWPLVVALHYFDLPFNAANILIAIATSFVLGYLSYIIIERPSLQVRKKIGYPIQIFALFFFTVSIIAPSAFLYLKSGYPDRLSTQYRQATKDIVMPLRTNGWCFYSVDSIAKLSVGEDGTRCPLGDTRSSIKAILFGDSFAAQYEPFWDTLGKDLNININSVTTNWCYPSLTDSFQSPNRNRAYQQCLINREFLKTHVSNYDIVILSGAWGDVYDRQRIQEVFDALSFVSHRVRTVFVMAAPISYDENVRQKFERSLILHQKFDMSSFGKKRDMSMKIANSKLKEHSEKFENIHFIDRDSLFLADSTNPDVTAENIPYSLDGRHLSVYGSKKAARSIQASRSYSQLRHILLGCPVSESRCLASLH